MKNKGCNKRETFAGGMFEVFCGKSEMWYGTFYCKECKNGMD